MSWRDMRRRRASADTSAVVVTRRLARRDAILSVQDKSGRLGYLHGTLSRYQKPLQSTEAVVTISTQSRVISIWVRLSETTRGEIAHSLLEGDTTDRFRKITVQQSHQTPKPDLGGSHGAEKTTAHPHSHDTLYLSTASDDPAVERGYFSLRATASFVDISSVRSHPRRSGHTKEPIHHLPRQTAVARRGTQSRSYLAPALPAAVLTGRLLFWPS